MVQGGQTLGSSGEAKSPVALRRVRRGGHQGDGVLVLAREVGRGVGGGHGLRERSTDSSHGVLIWSWRQGGWQGGARGKGEGVVKSS